MAPIITVGGARSEPTSGVTRRDGSWLDSTVSQGAPARSSPRGGDAEETRNLLGAVWRGRSELPVGPRPADFTCQALPVGPHAAAGRFTFLARRVAPRRHKARSGHSDRAVARRQSRRVD